MVVGEEDEDWVVEEGCKVMDTVVVVRRGGGVHVGWGGIGVPAPPG